MSTVDDAGHPRGSKAPTIRRVLILAAAMALILAAPASAQASWLISKRAAISDARRVVRDRGTWSADIAGDHYEMTFDRTQAIYAAPKARTQQRGTLAHAWLVGVGDPGQHDCRDVFGANVFGIPGVTVEVSGSRVPGKYWWRTVESVRCFGD